MSAEPAAKPAPARPKRRAPVATTRTPAVAAVVASAERELADLAGRGEEAPEALAPLSEYAASLFDDVIAAACDIADLDMYERGFKDAIATLADRVPKLRELGDFPTREEIAEMRARRDAR